MNKIQVLLSSIGLATLTTAALLVASQYGSNPSYLKMKMEESKHEAQEMKGAYNYYNAIAANQVTHTIDQEFVNAARESMQATFDPSFKKTRAFTNMVWGETGPNNIGGRSRVLVADKNVPNKLYMGGVGGGFWISTDNGDSWTKRAGNDSSVAIAVTSIAQAANGDIYYGTGEGTAANGFEGTPNGTIQLGEGIFKSTDGGLTFTQLTSTKPSNSNTTGDQWSYVNKLVADPSNPDKLYAATNGGLKVTLNGGTTWAKPSTLTSSAQFSDVDISSDGSVITACSGNILFISKDGGASFVNKTTALSITGAVVRMEAAIAPSDPNYVYVTIASGDASTSGGFKGFFKSTDKGDTWTKLTGGVSAIFNPFGNQGWYDIAFGVHPTNKDMVFLGGQFDLCRYTPSSGWKTIAYWANSPVIGRLVHADMHCIAFNPNNPENMYVTCDGGMYRTMNCSEPAPTLPFFGERNKNYSVTQCYGIAANNMGRIIWGSQDNGSGSLGTSTNSPQESKNLTGGDGTRCAISDLSPNFVFTSIVEGELRRASDGGQSSSSFKSFFDKNIDWKNSSADGAPDDGALWVSPIVFKEKMIGTKPASIFLYGTNNNVWMTQGALEGNPVWFKLFDAGTAVGFSALTMTPDGETVFAATKSGTIYRISVPNLWDSVYKYDDLITNMPPKSGPYTYPLLSSCVSTNIGAFPGRFITDLSCDNTGEVLIATLGNYGNNSYIQKTSDAISSTNPAWSDITANLPKMPVYSSLCLYGSGTKYMIGTDLGVWGSDNGGTSWTELNLMNADPTKWHPRVATYELAEKDTYIDGKGGAYQGSIVYTGTHGRGTFRSTSLSNYITPAPTTINNVSAINASINVYPNPASNNITIDYAATESSLVTISIYSLTGSLVKTERVNTVAGKNSIPMNISNLSQGGYIAYLHTGSKKATASFIKK